MPPFQDPAISIKKVVKTINTQNSGAPYMLKATHNTFLKTFLFSQICYDVLVVVTIFSVPTSFRLLLEKDQTDAQ